MPRRSKKTAYTPPEVNFDHTEFRLNSRQQEALPVSINQPVDVLAWVGRNEKGYTPGTDPNWDHPYAFTGHVRAPIDARARYLGLLPNEHAYEINPMAGRGTDNESFLAEMADPIADMVLQPMLEQQTGNGPAPRTGDPLDPFGFGTAVQNAKLTQAAFQTFAADRGYELPEEFGSGIMKNLLEKMNKNDAKIGDTSDPNNARKVIDKNILESKGFGAVQDPRARSELYTEQDTAIPYFVHGSITETKGDPDPVDTEPIFKDNNQYWLNWFRYDMQLKNHADVETNQSEEKLHENLISNHPNNNLLSGANQQAAVEYTWNKQHKQMFADYDEPEDTVVLLQYDGSDVRTLRQEQTEKDRDLSLLNG
jgi:hypothetical protein